VSVHRRGTRIVHRIELLTVKAGILENATYPADTLKNAETGETMPDPRAGMKVAVIAAALNYGTSKVPPRPFMDKTVAEQRRAWTHAAVTLMMGGMPARQALATVGQIMAEDIQHTITDWPADNSDEWARFKGFNHGLLFTSTLLRSVSSAVVEKGAE
jgi:hypothetical protein